MSAAQALGVLDVERAVTAAGLAPAHSEWVVPDGIGVTAVPEWVDSVGVALCDSALWLLVESQAPGNHPAGQLVLNLSPDRYVVDVYDLATSKSVSREWGEGPVLVVGLAAYAAPVAVRIRNLAAYLARPYNHGK